MTPRDSCKAKGGNGGQLQRESVHSRHFAAETGLGHANRPSMPGRLPRNKSGAGFVPYDRRPQFSIANAGTIAIVPYDPPSQAGGCVRSYFFSTAKSSIINL